VIKGLLLLLGFTLLSGSCDLFKKKVLTAMIIAQNICGATVDIYMDGAYQTSIANNANGSIEDVDLGTHQLEAIKSDNSIVVFSSTLEIDFERQYVWIIEGKSGFTITNQTGETIRLFIDGVAGGQILDGSTNTISEVPFGEHTLEAKKLNSETVLASTTITVEQIQVYTWIITI
jgi:hypothetical protein